MAEESERDEYIKQLGDVGGRHFIQFFKNREDFGKFFERLKEDERFLKSLVFMNALDSLEKEFSELKFILYFSLIEFIMSDEPFLPFHDWLSNRVSKKSVMLDRYITLSNWLKRRLTGKSISFDISDFNELSSGYRSHHGSIQKIKKFFKMYVSKESQIKMMDSFRLIKESNKKFIDARIRTDYCSNCTDEFRLSNPSTSICPGYRCDNKNNSQGLEEDVNTLVSKIIKIRNAVIHNAEWIIYPSKVSKKGGIEISLSYGTAYSQINMDGENCLVIISESPGEYFKIIDEGILNFFNKTVT